MQHSESRRLIKEGKTSFICPTRRVQGEELDVLEIFHVYFWKTSSTSFRGLTRRVDVGDENPNFRALHPI